MNTLTRQQKFCKPNNLSSGNRKSSRLKKKYVRKKKQDRAAPAKERLKGFLLNRLKGKAIWTRLSFKQFAELTGLSDRQIRRAKNELEKNDPDLVFRTSTKAEGKGWVVLVAKKENLKFDNEPLFYKENGESRHLRPNMLSSEIEQPTDIPTLIEGSLDQQKNINSETSKKNEQPKTYSEKSDTETTAEPDIDFSNHTKTTNEGGNGKMEGEDTHNPNSKQKKLAHIIKNALEEEHWENCKVKYSPGHAYNYALKALVKGYDTKAIIGAYDYAVHVRHGDATDIGLNTGNKYYTFEASSTISLAQERLEKTKGKCVKKDAMLFTKKARRKYEAQKKEFEDSNTKIFEQQSVSDRLRKSGFRENDIKIFDRFQKNKLGAEHIRAKAKLLANMARSVGSFKQN